jgi:hypothetical protein
LIALGGVLHAAVADQMLMCVPVTVDPPGAVRVLVERRATDSATCVGFAQPLAQQAARYAGVGGAHSHTFNASNRRGVFG